MKWNRYPQKRPELGQKVLIFTHGYDITGTQLDRYMKLEGYRFA